MRLHFAKSYATIGWPFGWFIPCSAFLCCIRSLSISHKMHTNGYVSALIVLQYSLTFFVSLEKPVHLYLYLCKSVSVAGFVLFLLFRESIWNKNKEVLRGHNEKIEEQSDASTCEANQQNTEEELLLFFCCFFFSRRSPEQKRNDLNG